MKKATNPMTGEEINTIFNRVLTFGLTSNESSILRKQIPNTFDVRSCDDNFIDLIALQSSCIILDPSVLNKNHLDILNECYEKENRILFFLTKKTRRKLSFTTHYINLSLQKSRQIGMLAKFLEKSTIPCISNCNAFMFNDGFVVIDIETTGLNPKANEIISISAIRVADYKIHDRFHCYVKPSTPLTPFIEELTGITNDMIANAPNLQNVIDQFSKWYAPDPLVMYNKKFDLQFLEAAHYNTGHILETRGTIDAFSLSTKIFANQIFDKPQKLKDLTETLLGEDYKKKEDVDSIAELFIFLLNKLQHDYEFYGIFQIAKLYDETEVF